MSHFAKHLPGSWRVNTTSNYTSLTGSFERSAYLKGDSIIVIAIDTVSNGIDLKFSLPYEVKSGKHIYSTSLTSLCNEVPIEIAEPTKDLTVTITGHSVNTFIFQMKDKPTEVRTMAAEGAGSGARSTKRFYNLHGQRVNKMLQGQIYIIDGKKIIAGQE